MKHLYSLLIAFLTSAACINAQTSCVTRTAATEANESIAGSTASWTTTGNASSSNDVRDISGNLASAGQYTDRLKLTDFGFAIPSYAVIQGISVDVERSIDGSGGSFTDRDIMLVKGGTTQTATNKATTAVWPATTDGTVSYGSSSDVWGNSWTPADINASGFGFAIAVIRTTSPTAPKAARIDSVSITVCYLIITPLKIKSFTVTKTANGSAAINWVTTNEQNVKTVQLQKSVNGVDFNLFTNIAPKGKYSTSDNLYQTNDNLLLNGTTYYRLKVIDEDGSFNYSEIRTITESNNYNRAYINYNNQLLNVGINNAAGNYSLLVTDVLGRVLYSKLISAIGRNQFVSIPFKLNTQQLIFVSLKGNDLFIQKKYLANN